MFKEEGLTSPSFFVLYARSYRYFASIKWLRENPFLNDAISVFCSFYAKIVFTFYVYLLPETDQYFVKVINYNLF